MKSRSVTVLAVAALVFLVVAYLLSRGSAEAETPPKDRSASNDKKPRIVYPREQKKLRVTRRVDDPRPGAERQRALDSLQKALLSPEGKGVVFVEANALRHSPLMEKILKCREEEAADGLMQLKNELGIDPMEDLDRVGFDGDVFAASGFFDGLKVPPELGEGEQYGDGARIWHQKGRDGEQISFARVGNDLMLTGRTEAEVKAAVDRVEGRAASTGAMPAGVGESELYGEFGAEFLKGLIGNSQDPTAKQIVELVTKSTVRMNVDEDAALSLDMEAVDEKSAEDLSKAVGGAFAYLRAEAEKEDPELAQLLEQARVQPGQGKAFLVDVAVPGEFLLKTMGCDKNGVPIARSRPPATK